MNRATFHPLLAPTRARLLASIYAARLRWAWAALAAWLEDLPPFWTAYALTLTETVGATILALPIAVAAIGPLAGVAILIVLGIVNMLTIACMAEAVSRSGSVRYGTTFTARMVADYLGGLGSSIFSLGIFVLCFLLLQAYYVGFATTMQGATGVPAFVWVVAIFLVGVFFVRRESISATVASALVIGAINIALIGILSLLAFAHLDPANLLFAHIPFIGSQPFDAGVLKLIFGVILTAYFGHLSVSNCGRMVLQRDFSGRSLIWGTVAAQATAMALYCLFVVAVNGAISPELLARETGTALAPLAAKAGPAVHLFGSALAMLSMGMASIHFSLALFNLTREWLPARSRLFGRRLQQLAGRSGARFWLGMCPIVAAFVCAEALLLTGTASFAGLLGFVGVIVVALLAGIFPVLLLLAGRRKGEYVPAIVYRFLGHPALLAGIYLLAFASVLLHGLAIWDDAIARIGAALVAIVIAAMTLVMARRGAFNRRMTIELREDQRADGQAVFAVTASGRPAIADIHMLYPEGERCEPAAGGTLPAFTSLRRITFKPRPNGQAAARYAELKVWGHTITPQESSDGLPALVNIRIGGKTTQSDLRASGGCLVLPLGHDDWCVDITPQRE